MVVCAIVCVCVVQVVSDGVSVTYAVWSSGVTLPFLPSPVTLAASSLATAVAMSAFSPQLCDVSFRQTVGLCVCTCVCVRLWQ